MLKYMILIAVALSVVEANGWFIVPTYVIVLCWIFSIVCLAFYYWGKGFGDEISKRYEDIAKAAARMEVYKHEHKEDAHD